MGASLADSAFQAYFASVILLGLNLLVLANNTALFRAFAKEVVNPEDKKLRKEAEVVYEEGCEKVERYRRAHRNALENIPIFLITGFLMLLTNPSSTLAVVLFSIFTAARLSHSVAYIKKLQPLRTASFAIGALVQIVVLGVIGYGVFIA